MIDDDDCPPCQQPTDLEGDAPRRSSSDQPAGSRSMSYPTPSCFHLFLFLHTSNISQDLLERTASRIDQHQAWKKRQETSSIGGRTIYELSEDKSNLPERKKETSNPYRLHIVSAIPDLRRL